MVCVCVCVCGVRMVYLSLCSAQTPTDPTSPWPGGANVSQVGVMGVCREVQVRGRGR